mgnify:CR=1 FL=1
MSESMIVRPQGGNGVSTARQGFGEQAMERRDSAAAALAERAKAEVQARYIVALQCPRDLDEVRVRVLDHCKRPFFADKARYSKPVGGNSIEGPSIRFVETALGEYGNVMPESTIVHEDDRKIVVRVTVTDLERNITHAAEATVNKTVERKFLKQGQRALSTRVNSYGDQVHLVEATDDEVANKKASTESKLIRNLGLRILPADIVEEAMSIVKGVQEAGIKADPAAEKRKLIDAFHELGVNPKDLAAYLGHDVDKVVPAELLDLRAKYAALKDGETTWQAVMDSRQAESEPAPEPKAQAKGTKAVKDAIKKKAKPAAEPDPMDTEIADIKAGLELCIQEPHRVAGLRQRIATLPEADREPLAAMLADAESIITQSRDDDDVPE